jgi:opacity protein-like surface antigen
VWRRPFATAVTNFGNSKINVGWTVGAGVEGVLVGNWNWKAEYLYMDLGSINDPTAVEIAVAAALLVLAKVRLTRTPISPTASSASG